MADKYTVTRKEVAEAAHSLLGVKFRHQGRDPKTGVDCVGFLIALATRTGYPHTVFDDPTYRRLPDEAIALKFLRMNMEELPSEDIGIGDIISMKIAGREVHVGLKIDEKRFIHAKRKGFTSGAVQIDYIRDWEKKFRRGFRLKGLVA